MASPIRPIANYKTTGPAQPFPALVRPDGVRSSIVGRARLKSRHILFIALFILIVPVPVVVSGLYLVIFAQPQFNSTVSFVVHAEGEGGAASLLAGMPTIAALAGTPSSDADILFNYLDSQALVARIDHEIDLRALWSGVYARDPVFGFNPEGSIEDLTLYWRRMVRKSYDPGAGVIEVDVRGFDAVGVQTVAQEIVAAGSEMINRLSNVARSDRLRHAGDELRMAEDRLANARLTLTSFRARHRVIDPIAELAGEMEVVRQLQRDLIEETVAMEHLSSAFGQTQNADRRDIINDGRIRQSQRRIDVLQRQIDIEREKFGGHGGQRDYAQLMEEFEKLSVNVSLAQEGFAAALAAFEATRASADRQSRYVSSFAPASLAERALYPKPARLLLLIGLGFFLIWAILMLVVYSLRDRM